MSLGEVVLACTAAGRSGPPRRRRVVEERAQVVEAVVGDAERAGGEVGVAAGPLARRLLEHEHARDPLARRVRGAEGGVAGADDDDVMASIMRRSARAARRSSSCPSRPDLLGERLRRRVPDDCSGQLALLGVELGVRCSGRSGSPRRVGRSVLRSRPSSSVTADASAPVVPGTPRRSASATASLDARRQGTDRGTVEVLGRRTPLSRNRAAAHQRRRHAVPEAELRLEGRPRIGRPGDLEGGAVGIDLDLLDVLEPDPRTGREDGVDGGERVSAAGVRLDGDPGDPERGIEILDRPAGIGSRRGGRGQSAAAVEHVQGAGDAAGRRERGDHARLGGVARVQGLAHRVGAERLLETGRHRRRGRQRVRDRAPVEIEQVGRGGCRSDRADVPVVCQNL